MFALSEAAAAFLSEELAEAEAPDDAVVRLLIEEKPVDGRKQPSPVEGEEQRLTLQVDKVRPGDATFDHGGRTVLVVNEQISELLADKTLDVKDTDEGPKLALL